MKRIVIALWFLLAAQAAFAVNGTIQGVRVTASSPTSFAAANGAVLEVDITGLSTGGSYTFGLGTNNAVTSAAYITCSVTSSGYTSVGGTTTIARTIYGTLWWRKPYPNNAVADESTGAGFVTVRVGLSDWVYASDTLTCTFLGNFYNQAATASIAASAVAVTNNSTQAYPSAIAQWATVPYQRVTGAFGVEAAAFDRFGVAAVTFTCADAHSNSVSHTVTLPTVSKYAGLITPNAFGLGTTPGGDIHAVVVYQGLFTSTDVASYTQGDVITCDWTVYPVIGTTNPNGVLTSNTAVTPPSEKLSHLLLLCDRTGAYGLAFAVVDPTNGHASALSTWVAATQATAESSYVSSTANSYANVGYAVQGIKAYNNTNYSRNEPGNGTILIATATNALPGNVPGSSATQKTWLTITNVSTVANATLTTGSVSSINVNKLRILGISATSASTVLVEGNTTDSIWWDNDTINYTGGVALAYIWQTAYATRNLLTAAAGGLVTQSANTSPYVLVRGNSVPHASGTTGVTVSEYCVLGNTNVVPTYTTAENGANNYQSDGAIVAFNTWFKDTNNPTWNDSDQVVPGLLVGEAYVQNLVERITNSNIIATSWVASTTNSSNFLYWHNLTLGGRVDLAYNTSPSSAIFTIVPHAGSTGSSFNTGDVITVTGNWTGSTLQKANATVTASAGAVTSLALTNAGFNYTAGNGVTAAKVTGSGTGLTVDITITSTGQIYFPNWHEFGNIWDNWNYNGDASSGGSNAAWYGNMSIDYGLGFSSNVKRSTQTASYQGVFTGLNTLYNPTACGSGSVACWFVTNAAFSNTSGTNNGNGGSGSGNGDYHLTSVAGVVDFIPHGQMVIPYDLDGQIRNNSGWGSAGPYEQAIILTPAIGWW